MAKPRRRAPRPAMELALPPDGVARAEACPAKVRVGRDLPGYALRLGADGQAAEEGDAVVACPGYTVELAWTEWRL